VLLTTYWVLNNASVDFPENITTNVDTDTNYTIIIVQFVLLFVLLVLFLRKSTKTVATRAACFDLNAQRIVCRLRIRPRPES